jgi:DNA end-binding protein Ku
VRKQSRDTSDRTSRRQSNGRGASRSRASADVAEVRGAEASTATRPARALWSGTMGFGLIQIPVRLLTAEVRNELAFHQLDRRDGSRIGYERVSKTTGERVEWQDIVKGYEIEKGRFVVLEPEDFQRANVRATQTIEIVDFVGRGEIPWPFLERPYYVVPEARGRRAYAVLRDALAKKGYVGIALVVLRTRQHLGALVPQDAALVLEILRFAHELKPMPELGDLPTSSARDVALAEKLMEAMVSPWEPAKYRDAYADDLLAAIRTAPRRATPSSRRTTGRAAADMHRPPRGTCRPS